MAGPQGSERPRTKLRARGCDALQRPSSGPVAASLPSSPSPTRPLAASIAIHPPPFHHSSLLSLIIIPLQATRGRSACRAKAETEPDPNPDHPSVCAGAACPPPRPLLPLPDYIRLPRPALHHPLLPPPPFFSPKCQRLLPGSLVITSSTLLLPPSVLQSILVELRNSKLLIPQNPIVDYRRGSLPWSLVFRKRVSATRHRREGACLPAGDPSSTTIGPALSLYTTYPTSTDSIPGQMSANPRRTTTKTTSSPVTPSTSSPDKTVMSLRKGATFHSPSSSPTTPHIQIPSLPRRSQTTLEDVVEAHKRRVALTLGDIDRGLSSVDLDSSSPARQSFRDEALPVPQGFLNHVVAAYRPDAHNGIMSDILTPEPADYHVGGRSLRPRRPTRAPSHYHASDSGLGSSIKSESNPAKRGPSHGLTLVTDDQRLSSVVTASAITRSAAAHPSTLESLPRLSVRAANRMQEHILKPLLANSSLKDFHPILRDCPRRIHEKEIVCLRDLEKTLVFMAPERSQSAKLYLDFCLTSIRCIQATVEFLNEREQTRPQDRPYTNGYFVDLVDQIRNYAQQVQASKEKEAQGEELDEMDAESSDEVKLYGGLNRNGRPAELIRVKKNGKAVSIATGETVKMESIEDDEKGAIQVKRSMSEEAEDEESILRSMARRKRSASAAELAPKRCREPGCTKEFKRSCDLTKHEKTHSRPWKCTERSCKYHEYGWPTEKELDRHINDKHSACPVLYKCQFAPCPYKSKRESNCKQHMEKSHGWTYVRSKNNGKNRSKAGDSSLPTPQTSNHRTPESDSHDEPTPDEEDYEMSEGYTHVGFDQHVYGDQPDFPEYPQDEFMIDGLASLPPFISPVESHHQLQSVQSSEHTSPYLVNNNIFQLDNVRVNFGPNFGNENDFTLYEEDIYSANARVQLPTPSNSIFQQQLDIDSFIASVPIKADPAPHISPRGHGNTMLYTPTSQGAAEDSFDHFDVNDHSIGNDFQLFSNANANMLSANSHHVNNVFGEAPSAIAEFSQSNTQEFFQAFYNNNSAAGNEWLQHDEGYAGAFGDHHVQ